MDLQPEDLAARAPRPRPFIHVLFECCRVYQRVTLNANRTAFVGWCPRCCARVEFPVATDGSGDRFFRAQ